MVQSLRNFLRQFHPRNWRALRRSLQERDHNHCHVLSRSPAIIYLWWGRDDSVLHKILCEERLILLYLFPWCTKAEDIPTIADEVKSRLRDFPRHRIILLCNEKFTVEPLLRHGVEALFCNQNAFVNERVFRPFLTVEKRYDAVYNACMTPYKRHPLASEVKSLMLMTYRYSGTHSTDYEMEVRTLLQHADWVKNSFGDKDKVSTDELVKYYNLARSGLCLSEIEGSMFASIEYMLCGLPVVSTPCVGGRDTFWDPEFVTIAEPEPTAIAEAVDDLVRREVDPNLVRSNTLKKVEIHRQTLRKALSEEVSADALEIPWLPGSHGVTDWTDLKYLAKSLRSVRPT